MQKNIKHQKRENATNGKQKGIKKNEEKDK